MPITLNPNQPLPVVLSSNVCPPPVWPLPVANWVPLPVVAEGFPAGPFTPTYTGPVGDGLFPGPSFCPGQSIAGLIEGGEPIDPGELAERRHERREEREERREERHEDRDDRRRRRRLESKPGMAMEPLRDTEYRGGE
jgi:hypothetical protein